MKVTLLLDLDETVFSVVRPNSVPRPIHDAHHLSYAGSQEINYRPFDFYIINPKELKTLIESVYRNEDDIAVFTAGTWPKCLLELIATGCNLEPDAAEKLKSAVFLNPEHDCQVLGCTNQELVRTMPKAYRLNALLPNMPEPFRSGYFTLLDNEPGHVASCEHFSYIDAVRATTDEEHKTFYTEVLDVMNSIREKHKKSLHELQTPSSISVMQRFFCHQDIVTKNKVLTQLVSNEKINRMS
jgi:hypothetical protein